MTARPTRLARNAIQWLGGAFLLLMPIAGAAWLGWQGYSLLESRRAHLSDLTATATRLKGAMGSLRTEDASRPNTATAALVSDFFPASQDSIVSAELHGALRKMALAVAIDLNSSNALPVRRIDQIDYIGIRAVFRGQLPDIQRLLHAVETNAPLLVVERLAMRVDTWPIKSADPAIDGAPALVAELDVFSAKLPSGDQKQQASQALPVQPANPASQGLPIPAARPRGARAP